MVLNRWVMLQMVILTLYLNYKKRLLELLPFLIIKFTWCGGSVVSTRMLLSSHYLHDYSDFYSDFGINSLHTFV